MSEFPYRNGWVNVGSDPDAFGVYLLDIDIGRRYKIATAAVEFIDDRNNKIIYTDSILNQVADKFRVDIFARTSSRTSISITVPLDEIPFDQARRSGVIFQNCIARLRWGVANRDHQVQQTIEILTGFVGSPKIDESKGIVSFVIKPYNVITGAPFPPAIAQDDYIADIDPEALGKVYPIIIGLVKQCPAFAIDAGVMEKFLVAADPFFEYTVNPTAGYDGDDVLPTAGGTNGNNTDGGQNSYFYYQFPAGSGAASKDVTFDVQGSEQSSLDKLIPYLLRGFARWDYGADKRRNISPVDIVDIESIMGLEAVGEITFAMIINQRSAGGVLSFIRDRILPQVPVIMFQDGGKIKFRSLLWDRRPVKRLSFDKNIFQRVTAVSETPIESVYNSFTFNYAVNGFRGDYEGCIVRNWDNDSRCSQSQLRYGRRDMGTIDLADLDINGVSVVSNWFIDTYGKMRVFVSYECDLDVVDVHMLDTVSVNDPHEGWEHDPLFRVHGIRRTSKPSIILDLVSVDDYVDLYRVNYKTPDPVGPVWPAPPVGGGWGDGAPEFVVDEGWGDGGADFS